MSGSPDHPRRWRAPPVDAISEHPGDHVTDSLLAAAGSGDLDAFADFYDRTAAAVFGLCRSIVSGPEQAEQITTKAYLRVWRAAPGFDPAAGSAWALVMSATRCELIAGLRRIVVHDCVRRAELREQTAVDTAFDRMRTYARRHHLRLGELAPEGVEADAIPADLAATRTARLPVQPES